MMLKSAKSILTAALLLAAPGAYAADLYIPPVEEAPPPPVVYQDYGGWYLRGDLDYHWSKARGAEYTTYGGGGCVGCLPGDDFDSMKLKGAFSVGAGIGYQINSYLRTDLTADYWFKSDFEGKTSSSGPCVPGGAPCSSVDDSSMSALLLLANVYVDLGTYQGITPYVGAGIGGAYVMWDDLSSGPEGESNWRFAWALMTGASYCLTDNLDLDVGYRFSRIAGGKMAKYDPVGNVGPFYDDGFNTHEVRAGLRYQFGSGSGRCHQPEVVAYEPPAIEPVYK